MNNSDKNPALRFTRRSFFAKAGTAAGTALGAGLGLQHAMAAEAARQPASAGLPRGWQGFDPSSAAPVHDPRQMPKAGEKIHEYDIDLTISVHEILPGVRTHAFTYNGTFPGPEIRVPEGDWALVNFRNRTSEFHTIHWHGLQLANEMDGVPLGTQWGVGKDQTFRYLFRAQPAGTHFYHCHNMASLHVQAGMFGAIIIEPKHDIVRETFPYEREYTLLLSEIDTAMVEREMNEMLRMSTEMTAMERSGHLMNEMNGRMMGWFKDKNAFLEAVKSGYIPPYSKAFAGARKQAQFDYFMINGKSYPMTESMMIKRGENIRVRLIGAGMMSHSMHLHGHDFWQVCQDGSPLVTPLRLNTLPVHAGMTADIIIQGTNPGCWHFHDHNDVATTNNGVFPGGMMTMLMYEDLEKEGVKIPDVIQVSS